MEAESLCVAPDEENRRCNNPRISNWHCLFHDNICLPLYKKYKDKQRDIEESLFQAVNLNLTIPQLWKEYAKIKEIYELRRNYRRLGFLPQFWDKGHDKQLQLFLNKLTDYENILSKKYEDLNKEISSENEKDNAHVVEEQEPEPPDTSILEMIKYRFEIIKEEEQIWKEEIPKKIQENDVYKKRCLILNQLIECIIQQSCEQLEMDQDIISPFVLMSDIVNQITSVISGRLKAGSFYVIRRGRANQTQSYNCLVTSEKILTTLLLTWKNEQVAKSVVTMAIKSMKKIGDLCLAYWWTDEILTVCMIKYHVNAVQNRKRCRTSKDNFVVEELTSEVSLKICIPVEHVDPKFFPICFHNIPHYLTETKGMIKYY